MASECSGGAFYMCGNGAALLTERAVITVFARGCWCSESRRVIGTAVDMEWTHEKTLELIEIYRDQPCLWDPQHLQFKRNSAKGDAWKTIGAILGCDAIEVKKKMESLMASFRRERQKCKMIRSGKYTSRWFAFKSMLFLMNRYKEKDTEITIEAPEILQESIQTATVPIEVINIPHVPQSPDMPTPFINQTSILPRKRKVLKAHRTSRKRRMVKDARAEPPFDTLKSYSKKYLRDPSDVFGEHIAAKHRQYNNHVKSVVEHLICNILFEADMGKYDSPRQRSTVVSPSCPPVDQQLHMSETSSSYSIFSESASHSRPQSNLSNIPSPLSYDHVSTFKVENEIQ